MRKMRWQECALLGAIFLQATFTFLIALTRLNTFKSSIYDIGVFQQIITLMTQGKAPLTNIIFPEQTLHWFGFHFSPILYLLVPFHWVFPSPVLLIVAQSLLIAASGWIVYRAILLRESNETYALVWALLYLLNPYLLNAAVNDFHEICFAVPLFAGVIYCLLAKRFVPLVVLLLLLALTKEHYGLAIIGTGMAWACIHKDYKRGALLVVLGTIILVLVIGFLMPWFNGGEHPMLAAAGNDLDRYGWLKLPMAERISFFWEFFLPEDKRIVSGIDYLLLLFGLSGFISFLNPILLLPVIADLGANIFSANVMPRGFFAYHSAPMMPVLFVTSFMSMQRFKVRPLLLLTASTLLLGITYFQNNVIRHWQIDQIVLTAPEILPGYIEKTISPNNSLSIQANFGVHPAYNLNVNVFPYMSKSTDYILLSLQYPYAKPNPFLFSSPFGRIKDNLYLDAVKEVLVQPDWCIAYWKDPILLLKRLPCSYVTTQQDKDAIEVRLQNLEKVIAELKKQL